MTDFPTSTKSFSALIDGTTYMEAANVNTAYDEVEALETFVGASGAAQSHNLSLLELLQNSYVGLRCYKKDDDEVYISAGSAIITNAAASVKKLRRTTSVATISASDLDTGSMAANTYYYIYAVADASGTSISFVFSASDSAPTGYTQYKKIGWFYNETASVLDITSGFVGNIKADGCSNPNVITVVGTDDITTTATSYGDMDDMEIKFVSNGRPVEITFDAPFYMAGNYDGYYAIVVDTTEEIQRVIYADTSNASIPASIRWTEKYDAGEHTIKIQWKSENAGGTFNQKGASEGARILSVKEL
jgi:hypothetical protein